MKSGTCRFLSTRFIWVRSVIFASPLLLSTMGCFTLAHAAWGASMDAQPPSRLPTVVPPTDSSTKQTLTNDSFIQKSAMGLLSDTELSKLALTQSANPKIKKFAQKIANESPAVLQKLQQAASTAHLEVPAKLDDEQSKMIRQMQTLKNKNFDDAFVGVMKKSLDTTVGLYDNAAGQVTLDNELRQFVYRALPGMRENQELVHTLENVGPAITEGSKPSQ